MSRQSASAPSSLSLKTKALYGMGEVSNSIRAFAFGLFLLFYYTSVLGLPGTLVGLATAVSLIWDALIDPFIGHISDKARFRFGRRHPFMLVGAICIGIGFFLVFSPPAGLSTGALFAWLIGTNFLLRTTHSLFMVPYHAFGAELSQDYEERTSITGIRAGFGLFGTLVAAGSSFVVFFPNTTPGVDPKFNVSSYASMGLAFGVAMTVFGLITTIGTWSHGAGAQVAQRPSATAPMGFFSGIALSLRNPSFLILTISTSIFFLASVVNATLAVHYLNYYARITDSGSLSLFQLSFYVGALAGVAFWLRMASRLAKHHVYIGATLIVAFLMAAAYGLVGEGHPFGTGNLIPLVIGNTVAGFFGATLWVVPASMIADVTDQDDLTTGRRREGAYFGIHSFFLQEAAGVALLITGILVDRFAGLIPGQVEQSPQTINRLAMLFSLLPAILLCGAALLMLGYGLTRLRVQAIQSELARRRKHTMRIADSDVETVAEESGVEASPSTL